MKKYIAFILTLSFCVCLFGCAKKGSVSTATESTDPVQTENTAFDEEEESTAEEISETESIKENSSEKSTSSAISESSSTLPIVTTEKNKESKTEKITQSNSSTTLKQTETSTKKVPTPEKTTVKPTSPAEIVCKVNIECKSVLDNKSKFKKDIATVPNNGIILQSASCNLKEGATAYDALKTVCAANGITLNTTTSPFGIYVAGIGGINEKDCGATSGWTYKVNGQSPSVAMDKYKLKNGDSITLSYVC